MIATDETTTMAPDNGQIKAPAWDGYASPSTSPAERLEAIEASLLRAHCLSKAINLMLLNDDDEPSHNGSTFRAAIEEVNECAHEAIQSAIDLVGKLAGDIRKGAVA